MRASAHARIISKRRWRLWRHRCRGLRNGINSAANEMAVAKAAGVARRQAQHNSESSSQAYLRSSKADEIRRRWRRRKTKGIKSKW
jgi:hypothetical protein